MHLISKGKNVKKIPATISKTQIATDRFLLFGKAEIKREKHIPRDYNENRNRKTRIKRISKIIYLHEIFSGERRTGKIFNRKQWKAAQGSWRKRKINTYPNKL